VSGCVASAIAAPPLRLEANGNSDIRDMMQAQTKPDGTLKREYHADAKAMGSIGTVSSNKTSMPSERVKPRTHMHAPPMRSNVRKSKGRAGGKGQTTNDAVAISDSPEKSLIRMSPAFGAGKNPKPSTH